jgi:hypothetical protein
MSLWLTELVSPSSHEIVTSLQDVAISVPKSVALLPQQTRSPGLSFLDCSPVILFFGVISFHAAPEVVPAVIPPTTVIIQLLSVPEPFSFTDRTIPVIGDPINVNDAFSP